MIYNTLPTSHITSIFLWTVRTIWTASSLIPLIIIDNSWFLCHNVVVVLLLYFLLLLQFSYV